MQLSIDELRELLNIAQSEGYNKGVSDLQTKQAYAVQEKLQKVADMSQMATAGNSGPQPTPDFRKY